MIFSVDSSRQLKVIDEVVLGWLETMRIERYDIWNTTIGVITLTLKINSIVKLSYKKRFKYVLDNSSTVTYLSSGYGLTYSSSFDLNSFPMCPALVPVTFTTSPPKNICDDGIVFNLI